jgi:Tfp pilus assembly protein FimT
MTNIFLKKGISAIDVIVSMAILVLIVLIVTPPLSSFKNQQVLKNTAEEVVSVLNQARSQTVSSKNSLAYGVWFGEDRMVLYSGAIYNPSAADNQVFLFNDIVSIALPGGVSLAGGGTSVNFRKLTGDVNEHGSIVLQLTDNPSQTRTVSIRKTGVISSQ